MATRGAGRGAEKSDPGGCSATLVIFDCDGVLVDSEPVANRLLAELLTAAGLPTTTEQSYAEYRGRTQAACIALAEAKLGRSLPEDFGRSFDSRFNEACAAELQPIPGVGAAIGALEAAGLDLCVASSGSHEKMRMTLRRTLLDQHFEGRIYSATKLARSKPHPDIFLHAAEQMGRQPGDCCVIEDSLAGVKAGLAAGMYVLGFADGAEAAMLENEGAHVFSDMEELPALVLAARPPG